MDEDYLTSVEYTGSFYHFLAPARLAYVAAINGFTSPKLTEPFTWCELGCGKGITSLILAATHPNGKFYACDLNPAHIDYAESLRRSAGVENLALYAKSFAEMLEEDRPAFDFITLHGVYSWINDPVRAHVHELIRRRLKPGGLVMVSYNAMPGWAELMPLRHMVRIFAEAAEGSAVEKVRQAFARMEFLAKNGAAYFTAHPSALEWLEEIADQDVRYVVHEYLTPTSTPFYVSEVAAAMAGLGLSFVGSTVPRNNYAELMAPARFDPLLAETPSRIALELQRDFIGNVRFRRDVFAAQPRGAGAVGMVTLQQLDAVAFSLTTLPEQLPLRSDDGMVVFNLEQEKDAVAAMHRRLEQGPALANELHEASGMTSEQESAVLIQKLVVAGHLDACTRQPAPAGWPKLNSLLIEAGLREQAAEVALACPSTGAASNIETLHAVAIEAALRFGNAEDAAEAVVQRLRHLEAPVFHQREGADPALVTDVEIRQYVRSVCDKVGDTASAARRLLQLYGLVADSYACAGLSAASVA